MWPSLNVVFWTEHVRIRGLFPCTPDSVHAMGWHQHLGQALPTGGLVLTLLASNSWHTTLSPAHPKVSYMWTLPLSHTDHLNPWIPPA